MRYAILSDIHGNAPALADALADASTRHVDGFLLAGDYYLSVPYPNEVISILRGLDARAVRGNQLKYLTLPRGNDGQRRISYWCADAITDENKSFLFAMPERVAFSEDGVAVYMTHSAADLFGEAWRSHFRSSSVPKRYGNVTVERETLLRDIRAQLVVDDDTPPGVYVFGHSHLQWHARVGDRLLINPGSCGVPLDSGAPGAPYTVLDIKNGTASVEEYRAVYDVDRLIRDMRASEQYKAAPVWSEIIMRQLAERRELLSFFFSYADQYAQRMGDSARPFSVKSWEGAYSAWSADTAGHEVCDGLSKKPNAKS